jgi:hypothetical protein
MLLPCCILKKPVAGSIRLALAAAGKQNLLTRIEKIVGMEKKKTFKLVQIVPLFLAMFCVRTTDASAFQLRYR